MIRNVVVLVPVHNEQELLPRLIASVTDSLTEFGETRPDVGSAVIFGLDRCTDRSAQLVRDAGFFAVRSHRPGVGAARGTAATAVLDGLRPADLPGLWLANTDADSEVPTNWLTHQLQLADAGADVVIGSVRPRFEDLDGVRRAAWEVTHARGQALGHVHGANLGMRASTFLAAGGFEDVAEHEDVDLVARAMALGAELVASDSHTVTTSGRLLGRTPGGYASYLREQLLPLAVGIAGSNDEHQTAVSAVKP